MHLIPTWGQTFLILWKWKFKQLSLRLQTKYSGNCVKFRLMTIHCEDTFYTTLGDLKVHIKTTSEWNFVFKFMYKCQLTAVLSIPLKLGSSKLITEEREKQKLDKWWPELSNMVFTDWLRSLSNSMVFICFSLPTTWQVMKWSWNEQGECGITMTQFRRTRM